jgi:hypothetical protein
MRYLLYIDILGFSSLVEDHPAKVEDLYEVIASLHAHRHGDFKSIIFSDTVLVYSVAPCESVRDKVYLVMYLCEFAQDLLYRLTGRDIVFRAVLTRGEFRHYELNSMPCFFGNALIRAYRSEKQIKAVGLFIDRAIEKENHIFQTRPYNDQYSCVFLTQSIRKVETLHCGTFPLDRFELEGTDLIWNLTAELLYLRRLYQQATSQPDAIVRAKYANTWALFREQYPRTTEYLAATQFELEKVCPGAGWDDVLARFPESYSFAVDARIDY